MQSKSAEHERGLTVQAEGKGRSRDMETAERAKRSVDGLKGGRWVVVASESGER